MSRALWWVSKGRAAAPPATSWSIGVSTSRKPRSLEEVADFGDHLRAHEEDVAAPVVGDEVEVALAVFGFRSAMPWHLSGSGRRALERTVKVVDLDGGFADLGGEGFALDADPVAEVEEFEDLEGFVADDFGVEEALDAAVDVGDVEEVGFAHVAMGDDAAGDADGGFFGRNRRAGRPGEWVVSKRAP